MDCKSLRHLQAAIYQLIRGAAATRKATCCFFQLSNSKFRTRQYWFQLPWRQQRVAGAYGGSARTEGRVGKLLCTLHLEAGAILGF